MNQTFLMTALCAVLLISLGSLALGSGGEIPKRDTFKTGKGELAITFVGHGTLMIEWNKKVIHVDPWTKMGDYSKMPKADLILITHEHRDHLDMEAIKAIRKDNTEIVLTELCKETVKEGTVMKNGESKTVADIPIDAVPAYNIKHEREKGKPFHPKGVGNGYVLTFDKTKVYIAGDTEDIPEMADLKNIDIAFLPMNLPYTMTPEMAAKAAKSFMPKILYPYHFGETDTSKLVELLKATAIEVRIRNLQ